MNCYNGEKYLHESIYSVLAQTYQNWELIFWDNQSTDKSSKIVQSYEDHRIQYHLSETFTPLGEARNEAIKKSQGEFIAFLDCDDLWMPEKLEKQIPLFSDLQVGLVICDTYFFNEKKILKQVYKKNKPPTGDVFRQLLGEYFVSLETAVLRRLALNSLDHWFDPKFNMIEEYDLFVRLGHQWHLAYVDQVLAKWRVHSDSWTWKHSAEFPKERKLMLQKLNYIIADFDKHYAKEIFFINRTCNLENALEAWKAQENRTARLLLQPYITSGLKWFLIYFCTWFPYQVFKTLWKMRGGIHP